MFTYSLEYGEMFNNNYLKGCFYFFVFYAYEHLNTRQFYNTLGFCICTDVMPAAEVIEPSAIRL